MKGAENKMIIKMILTNAFDPDPRVYKEAKTLIEAGHDVEILCWDRESKYKNNEVELIDGIKVRRFFAKGVYGSGYKQILGFLKFGSSVKRYIENNYCDAIHCHDFDSLFIGNMINKKSNAKLIFDEHDFFHLYFKKRRGLINSIIAKSIILFQNAILKNVDSHIVVTPKAKEFYKNKKNITIITNTPMKNSFNCTMKKTNEKITVGFIGTVRYYEELKALVDVAKAYENIQILIAGKGTALNKLESYIEANCLKNIEVFGEYKLSQIEDLYSKIDITYLVYPSEDSKVSLPNKFFESIITETPIIADRESEYGQIVESARLGWVVDFNNLEKDLKQIFEEICSDNNTVDSYKRNMRDLKDDYYWESNTDKLCGIY
jgi:glycosyltransferase involved in cell wall biosynthesis